MCRADGTRLPRATPSQTSSWVHLPCGHHFHLCCFSSHAASHPGETSPFSCHASLSCPTCHRDHLGDPAYIAGFRPDDTTLTLRSPDHTDLSFELPSEPVPLPGHSPRRQPPAEDIRWCPLSSPRTRGMCCHSFTSVESAIHHLSSHHSISELHHTDGSVVDLSYFGVAVCPGCFTVLPTDRLAEHASSCYPHSSRSQCAECSDAPPPSPPTTEHSDDTPPSSPPLPPLPARPSLA